jgi:hypothetical protein
MNQVFFVAFAEAYDTIQQRLAIDLFKTYHRGGEMSNEAAGLLWPAGNMLPVFRAPQHLDIYDIRSASHDVQLAATTMAGILNRPQPRVYLITGDDDLFWLQQVLHALPQATAPQKGNDVLTAMLTAYRQYIQGLIVYDPALIDTVNVATTLAGQRDAVVVAPAQVQDLESAFDLPVLVDLRTYQWRNRVQAYRWAQQNLLVDASSHLVAGMAPETMTGLRSFLVATRTFVYWLDSRKYLPARNEDLSERRLMQHILTSFSPGSLHLGWFIDESSGVYLTSRAAIGVLASDYCTNLEVLSAVQPQSALVEQSIPTTVPAATKKVYLSFTISDGDNLQYCQHRMLRLWHDPVRGSLPIGWTIAPALLEAAPSLAAYYLSTTTANDELIAGPSGASYMFPAHWPADHLSPFLQHTGQLMQKMGLKTLAVLDSGLLQASGFPLLSRIRLTGMSFTSRPRQHRLIQELASFGVNGLLSGAGVVNAGWKKIGDVPLYRNLGLANNATTAVRLIKAATLLHRNRPLFLNIYMLAWTITLADLKQAVEQLGEGYEVVLPGTLLAMLAGNL